MRFADQTFRRTADSGEEFAVRIKISVTQNGDFKGSIPDEFKNMFSRCEGTEYYARNKLRFSAKSLEELTADIENAIDQYLQFESSTELVIRYDVVTRCHYCSDKEGNIYTNAEMVDRDNVVWSDFLNHHSSFGNDGDYSIQLKAEVCEKTTMTRGENYSNTEYGKAEDGTGEYADLLNSFVRVDLTEDCREIPYTEEAAKFFYNGMIALCGLAEKLDKFFRDEKRVVKAIEAGSGHLLMEGGK